jgi:hypothetical protein
VPVPAANSPGRVPSRTVGPMPILLLATAAMVALAGRATAAGVANGPEGRSRLAGILSDSCLECHDAGVEEGGVDLAGLLERLGRAVAPTGTTGSPDHDTWVAVWKNLRAGTMPPADAPQPEPARRAEALALVEGEAFGLDPARPDPGHVMLRRLNRDEYGRTVRDLVGFETKAAEDFPPEDTGYGFDTIGEVLSLSPLVVEKFMAAADRVAEAVVVKARPRAAADGGREYPPEVRPLFPFGPPPEDPAERDAHRRRTVERLLERAFRRPADPATLARALAVAEAVAGSQQDGFERGVAAVLTAALASPRFLFRIEPAPETARGVDGSDEPPGNASAIPIDEFSLATRLSYFLWGTMPDDELFGLARDGRLRANLAPQVDRLLADRRSDAFVASFVGQWLQTRDVEALAFDLRRLLATKDWAEAEKIFSASVRRAMRQETEMLFAHILRDGRAATDLVAGRETFLNADLARYYGIEGVEGKQMRLVPLPPESHRRGLLTHGSFLVVTSNPTRTSPVKRGLFILDNLLGTPAPPAPADVPALEASREKGKPATMREQMERHRADPLCASCHARMDPLGLALESYDAIGRWRAEDDGRPIETAGRLITGESFADVAELAEVISGPRRRDFHRCLTEKLLTYALGRGIEYFDAPAVDSILERLDEDGRLATLVHAVVDSVPFQFRRPPTD